MSFDALGRRERRRIQRRARLRCHDCASLLFVILFPQHARDRPATHVVKRRPHGYCFPWRVHVCAAHAAERLHRSRINRAAALKLGDLAAAEHYGAVRAYRIRTVP